MRMPFFKNSCARRYVELDERQVNLGSDEDEAYERYHELMLDRAKGRISKNPKASEVVIAYLHWASDPDNLKSTLTSGTNTTLTNS